MLGLDFTNIGKSSAKIMIAAGGTGGHIIPALSVADLFLQKNCKVFFVTDSRFDGYSLSFSEICNHPNFKICYVKMPRHRSKIIQFMLNIFYAGLAIFGIGKIIAKNSVSVVVGFGSYVSLPSVVAGRLLMAKTFIHEQNSCMGLANRISMFFVKLAMLSFPETTGVPFLCKGRAVVCGFPLRKMVKELHYHNVIETINYESFFKIYDVINITVIGGSQGARVFQDIVPLAIAELDYDLREKVRVCHQTTKEDALFTKKFYVEHGIKAQVSSFFPNIPEMMAKSHIVISRSGAGTLFEIMALGSPSILIPYPFAKHEHQLKNAMFMQTNGAAIVVEQKDLTAKKLTDIMHNVFDDFALMAKLSHNAKQLALVDADARIVMAIEKIAGNLGKNIPLSKQKSDRVVATNVSVS